MGIKTKKGRKRFSEPLLCADRNGVEKVSIMGGTVIETESEKLIRQGMQQGIYQGRVQMIIEMGQDDGLDDAAIINRLQSKAGLSQEQAADYLQKYGRQLA